MGTAGFEPATSRLKTLSSSTELRSRIVAEVGVEPTFPGISCARPGVLRIIDDSAIGQRVLDRTLPLYGVFSLESPPPAAVKAGLEPATKGLTIPCSAIELLYIWRGKGGIRTRDRCLTYG